MRSWIPVPGTTSGRLALAALELFGAHGYAAVPVDRIAARAEVTTGSLYHHFGHKAGLYLLVRTDVEQRVIDRVEGAAAVRDIRSIADLAPVLSVGFDYLVRAGFARLLGEPPPAEPGPPPRPDPVEQLIDRLLPSADAPVGALIAAAWRVALWNAANDPRTASTPRAALDRLLTGR
jgi:AcrR family transcriptional regulator